MAMSGYSTQIEAIPLASMLETGKFARYARAADEAAADALRFERDVAIALQQERTLQAIYAQREAQAARRRARYLRILAGAARSEAS